MKIGVFDSGIGGLSVANAIRKTLPQHEIMYVNDAEHLPYGIKHPQKILGCVVPILQKLVKDDCRVIVIACNTVSTTLITELRQFIRVPLVAMEPMVKPAATLSRSKIIAVCATPTTLASQRYAWLKQTYAADVQVLEPDCSQWSQLIEDKTLNQQHIKAAIEPTLLSGADVIVLGCTHYHWIEQEIKQICQGRAAVLQPEEPVIAELQRVLERITRSHT